MCELLINLYNNIKRNAWEPVTLPYAVFVSPVNGYYQWEGTDFQTILIRVLDSISDLAIA